jgi:hypothetical protein
MLRRYHVRGKSHVLRGKSYLFKWSVSAHTHTHGNAHDDAHDDAHRHAYQHSRPPRRRLLHVPTVRIRSLLRASGVLQHGLHRPIDAVQPARPARDVR